MEYFRGVEKERLPGSYPSPARIELRTDVNRGRTIAAIARTAAHPIKSRTSGMGDGPRVEPAREIRTVAANPAGAEMPAKAASKVESTSAKASISARQFSQ